MRTNANSTFAAILLLIPLIAVLLLAVFGIPQFVPVVASPFANKGDFVRDRAAWSGSGNSTSPTGNDSFASFGFGGNTEPNVSVAESIAGFDGLAALSEHDDPWRPQANSLDGWHLLKEMDSESNAAQQSIRANFSALTKSSSGSYARLTSNAFRQIGESQRAVVAKQRGQQQLTWKSAVGRLNALGIRRFRLQPGALECEFHFVCFFTPSDNPRVTYRFEAEAIEPLRAVQKVLDQIGEWSQRRTF